MAAQVADEQRPAFLGEAWQHLTRWAKAEGDRLGLRVDATLGSSWPSGGRVVDERDAATTIGGAPGSA